MRPLGARVQPRVRATKPAHRASPTWIEAMGGSGAIELKSPDG
ncbi:hypothetical protein AKJ09_11485 [Labilithrix luteola]|uniref:Uncharacterized protein n=1 Tax=Labilithrix luteola TaxID=1391654 RepID=A0A0K1QGP4_9BACT|nr:hypothetical protein AKJ09_11485 [Labilithrix luteola]